MFVRHWLLHYCPVFSGTKLTKTWPKSPRKSKSKREIKGHVYRKCLVGDLFKVIGILSTTYKVCVMWCCTLCGIAQGSCRDRSPWAYLYDPRSGGHYSSWRWVGVLRQLHLTPGILDSDAGTPLLHPLRVPITRSWENQVICLSNKCLYDIDCCTTVLYFLVLSWLKPDPKVQGKVNPNER